MKITKRQLRKIIREEKHRLMREANVLDIFDFQEEIEWGDWPGRDASAVSGGWNYVESEGPTTVRFDWRGGSMWYTANPPMGTIEGNVPPSLKKHLEQKGIKVYTE